MSFVDIDDVMDLNEHLIARIFKDILDMDISLPLRRLTYREAMERFGSDKPDTRFGLELTNISDIVKDTQFKVFGDVIAHGGSVRGINVQGGADKFARRELDALVDFVKVFGAKGLEWITVEENDLKSPITKFLRQNEINDILHRMDAKPGDLLLFVADKDEVVFDALGQLRLELGKRLNLIDTSKYDLLWVTEFPLLEYSQEEKRYVAKHHPFTSPMDEDIALLDSEPWKARSKAYDMVLNGNEIGGGSIRIHSTELQQKMFEVLGFSKEDACERFGFLLKAFEYGAPPHGGMAYGLDRLLMILAGLSTIRDVIAFPKIQNASCPLTEAPSPVDEKQLRELHIKVRES